MPVTYEDDPVPHAVFTGQCVPQEADALLEWLRATPAAAADLSACDALHTALAQLLMAARVRLLQPPAGAVLADCLRAAGCDMGPRPADQNSAAGAA